MCRNKIICLVLLLAITAAGYFYTNAFGSDESVQIIKDGKAQVRIYWSKDGALEKITTDADNLKSEARYEFVENVKIDGNDLKKYKLIPGKGALPQTVFMYTLGKRLYMAENFDKNGKLRARGHYDGNSILSLNELDTNGKLDYRQYYKNGKLLRSESDKTSPQARLQGNQIK